MPSGETFKGIFELKQEKESQVKAGEELVSAEKTSISGIIQPQDAFKQEEVDGEKQARMDEEAQLAQARVEVAAAGGLEMPESAPAVVTTEVKQENEVDVSGKINESMREAMRGVNPTAEFVQPMRVEEEMEIPVPPITENSEVVEPEVAEQKTVEVTPPVAETVADETGEKAAEEEVPIEFVPSPMNVEAPPEIQTEEEPPVEKEEIAQDSEELRSEVEVQKEQSDLPPEVEEPKVEVKKQEQTKNEWLVTQQEAENRRQALDLLEKLRLVDSELTSVMGRAG